MRYLHVGAQAVNLCLHAQARVLCILRKCTYVRVLLCNGRLIALCRSCDLPASQTQISK